MSTLSILRFHYRNVLRQDFLSKYNYTHVLEVSRLCRIILVLEAPSNLLDSVKLAIENLCGQKCIKARSGALTKKSFEFNRFLLSQESERKAYVARLVQSVLRGHIMYKFLEKFGMIISLHHPIEIRRNSIEFHLSMATTLLLKEFPQLKENFEILAHLREFKVIIVTSANIEGETSFLWSGFNKGAGRTE
nr:ribosomal protein L subunit 5 [Haplopteris ensiformis]